MILEVKRKVQREVEEVTKMELKKFYNLRIIQGENLKTCIAEKEFEYVPDEQEIADFLYRFNGRENVCANIRENFRLVEVDG